MTAADRKGPFERTERQLLASDPASHVWVSASAGTGKTHVLTDRMLRLMLGGCAPDRILALTFTKAAAAEMQNRLTKRLGDWLTLDDASLDAELKALGVAPGGEARTRARCLFALALDVPGGLKVQTIHGFAQGLLAAFPLEAGLPPGFRALDDRDARLLRQRALNEAISQALAEGDGRFLGDMGELAVLKGEGGVMQALDRMIGHSEGVLSFRSEDGIAPAVRRYLKVGLDEKPGEFLAEVLAPGLHDDARLEQFAAIMAEWNTKTGDKAAADARAWLALDAAARAAAFRDYRGLVLTKEGTIRQHAFAKKRPDLAQLMADLAEDIWTLDDREARLTTAELATKALRAGHRIAGRYRQLKRANVAIDYDDMISHAAELLGPAGMPGYIGWKLDSRFDHVLVDEAQDTNARQWKIIERLIEDYFDGADSRVRSLFVVGDLKQAIYGFQGTEPRLFVEGAARISPGAEAGGRPLKQVPLDLSFRSGPAILEFVNAFLDHAEHAALGMAEAAAPHRPYRSDAPGEIMLWPVQTPEDPEEGDEEGEGNSEAADRVMADMLARQIAAWLEPGNPDRLWLPARGHYARPDEILVLVRKRSTLMGGLVAALHQQGVPVAGVDRLLLTEPYAVLDLLALVRFAVQPEDDLNLACVLVSPFIGWTHEEVRAISGQRKGSLWAALGQAAADGGAAREARLLLNQVLSLADVAGPYSFLDTILSGPVDGRRRLVARLGTEANDAVDELLQQALAYEVQHPPALAGFLAWIESEGSEVKRDAEAPAAQVRLMTIHGAKGLEAPVVVLADSAHGRKANGTGSCL
jgi:ATP-dependent helicase/nuclease subunit A